LFTFIVVLCKAITKWAYYETIIIFFCLASYLLPPLWWLCDTRHSFVCWFISRI